MLANADDVPLGSYLGSCGGCKVVDSELSCSACRNWHGATYASSISIGNCQDIGNSNGKLVCEDSDIPPGNYQASCTSCGLATNPEGRAVLTCRCKDARGKHLQDTALLPPVGAHGELLGFDACISIDNDNGELKCQMATEQQEGVEEEAVDMDAEKTGGKPMHQSDEL